MVSGAAKSDPSGSPDPAEAIMTASVRST